MLQRTLATVIESGVADRIVVSTDDDEIADLAIAAGVDVPFRRPDHLADDHTPTAPVVEHAISTIADAGETFPYVLVVYPTAVLVAIEDLRAGRDAVIGGSHRLAMSVGRFHAPVERAWRLRPDGTGEMRQPEHALTRTQDLEASYFDAGQFYFGTTEFWRSGDTVSAASPALIELPSWRTVDIDDEDDVLHVERLLLRHDEHTSTAR